MYLTFNIVKATATVKQPIHAPQITRCQNETTRFKFKSDQVDKEDFPSSDHPDLIKL